MIQRKIVTRGRKTSQRLFADKAASLAWQVESLSWLRFTRTIKRLQTLRLESREVGIGKLSEGSAMQIPVLIEPVEGNGYRARGGEPIPLVVEAPTREEALAKLQEALRAKLRSGAEIVPLETTPAPHPLSEFAGMFKDDPYFEDVVEIIAANRRKMNEGAKVP
jgi:hypothetical protein